MFGGAKGAESELVVPLLWELVELSTIDKPIPDPSYEIKSKGSIPSSVLPRAWALTPSNS